MLAKRVAVAVVKLIAVTVPFLHFAAAVGLFQEGARVDFTGISTQAHGTAFGKIALLVGHQIDDRVRPIGFEFAGVCFGKAQHVACKFNYRDLHAQADSQIGDVVLPGIFGGDNFALNTPLAESAGNQNTVTVGQIFLGGFVGNQLRLHPFDLDFGIVFVARMAQGFGY